jgi:hypothetical protein
MAVFGRPMDGWGHARMGLAGRMHAPAMTTVNESVTMRPDGPSPAHGWRGPRGRGRHRPLPCPRGAQPQANPTRVPRPSPLRSPPPFPLAPPGCSCLWKPLASSRAQGSRLHGDGLPEVEENRRCWRVGPGSAGRAPWTGALVTGPCKGGGGKAADYRSREWQGASRATWARPRGHGHVGKAPI